MSEGLTSNEVLKPAEIGPGFNSHFELPLRQPISGWGFKNCPVAVAITGKRVWVAHLNFMDKVSDTELWPDWNDFEQDPPKYVAAWGGNEERVERLTHALIEKTGGRVDQETIGTKKTGVFRLDIVPLPSFLVVAFSEKDNPGNNLSYFYPQDTG